MVKVSGYARGRPVVAVHRLSAGFPEGEVLFSRKYRRNGRSGSLYAIDVLLGDDEYVFLNVEAIPNTFGAGEIYVYDAEQLIREGALVRTEDAACLPEFEKLEAEIMDAGEHLWGFSFTKKDATRLARLLKSSGALSDKFEALQKRVQKSTLSGQKALDYIKNPSKWHTLNPKCEGAGVPELLVPKQLSIGKALGLALP